MTSRKTFSIENGLHPFWFWNDDLTAAELQWQIKQMANQGIKGFYIHPRQGLQQPYLSDDFFAMVDIAIKAAEDQGLVVHLYDEYPYPSGVAGGFVFLGNPQFYATKLEHVAKTIKGGKSQITLPAGKVLSAKVFPIKDKEILFTQGLDVISKIGIVLTDDSYVERGLTKYNRKRYFASNPTPVLALDLPSGDYWLYVGVQVEVSKHKYWDRYVDVLQKDAIDEFINYTHERYRQRYSNKFGNIVKSIFTDEITPSWSRILPQKFQKRYQYDLLEYLPALYNDAHPAHLQVTYDLFNLRYDLFCEVYEQRIANWCKENEIKYCGEKPTLQLSQLKYMDIPGCDPGHCKAGGGTDVVSARIRANARAVASAAYFYNKEGSLCECFHSLGWSATLQDAKFISETLLLMGINYLVPHGFFYSTHSLKKHDAPPTFFFQMPYWPFFHHLTKRIDKLNKIFAETYIDAQVVVVEPHSGIPSDYQLQKYVDLLYKLLDNHVDYHLVDTDILQSGFVEDSGLKLQDILAKVVVVPPVRVIESELKTALEKLDKSGIKIIYCKVETDLTKVLSTIRRKVDSGLTIVAKSRESNVWAVKRKNNFECLWFLLNMGDKEEIVELQATSDLEEVILDETSKGKLTKKENSYVRTIRPFESFVVRQTNKITSVTGYQNLTIQISKNQQMEFRPLNPNLVRLDDWQLGDNGNVQALPLGNQLTQSDMKFTPSINTYFGHKPELSLPELCLEYTTTFTNAYSGAVELLMEPGSIIGDWSIQINDKGNLTSEKFTQTTTHVRGSLSVNIEPYLRLGTNTIKVSVTTSKLDGGLINPLYLAGEFGVTLEPIKIQPLKKKGKFEQYRGNLLPYFSGVIEYITNFTITEIPDTEYVILNFVYDQPFREACEIAINTGEFQSVLWEPRSIVVSKNDLKIGSNLMKIRVYTSLIRSFAGEWFDYQNHVTRSVFTENA